MRFRRLKIPKKRYRRSKNMLTELLATHQPQYIIGIDEVGWGAVAGPVGIGCTVYKVGYTNPKIKDSKKYTENSRKSAYALVYSTACYVDYVEISVNDLALHGAGPMLQAAFLDVADRAAAQFPDSIVIIDGANEIKNYEGLQTCFPKADAFVCAVSAASVVAKVNRDRKMHLLSKDYPEFKWAVNKGYPTPEHMEAMKKYGVSVHHRRNIETVLTIEATYGEYKGMPCEA